MHVSHSQYKASFIDSFLCFPQLNNLEFDEKEISGRGRCPFDFKQTNVALFAGEHQTRPAAFADF